MRRPRVMDLTMAASGLPFDDIRELIAGMPGPDMAAANAVRARDKESRK